MPENRHGNDAVNLAMTFIRCWSGVAKLPGLIWLFQFVTEIYSVQVLICASDLPVPTSYHGSVVSSVSGFASISLEFVTSGVSGRRQAKIKYTQNVTHLQQLVQYGLEIALSNTMQNF